LKVNQHVRAPLCWFGCPREVLVLSISPAWPTSCVRLGPPSGFCEKQCVLPRLPRPAPGITPCPPPPWADSRHYSPRDPNHGLTPADTPLTPQTPQTPQTPPPPLVPLRARARAPAGREFRRARVSFEKGNIFFHIFFRNFAASPSYVSERVSAVDRSEWPEKAARLEA
jgi:hypothetical protein